MNITLSEPIYEQAHYFSPFEGADPADGKALLLDHRTTVTCDIKARPDQISIGW